MRQNQTAKNIIAIFARGREIGFVVIRGRKLRRWGVKTIRGERRGPAFAKSVEKALSSVLEQVGQTSVVVTERQASPRGALGRVIPEVLRRWKKQEIQPRYISLSEVKRTLCANEKATHQELVEAVGEKYPILLADQPQADYWQKVFIAVAMAEVRAPTNGQV